jgi:hypothetical protein
MHKEAAVPNCKVLSNIILEELRKVTRTRGRIADMWAEIRPRPSEYETGMLTILLRCPV